MDTDWQYPFCGVEISLDAALDMNPISKPLVQCRVTGDSNQTWKKNLITNDNLNQTGLLNGAQSCFNTMQFELLFTYCAIMSTWRGILLIQTSHVFSIQEITNGILLMAGSIKCEVCNFCGKHSRKNNIQTLPHLPFLRNQLAPPLNHAIGWASAMLCPFGPFKQIAEITHCTFKYLVCHPRCLRTSDLTNMTVFLKTGQAKWNAHF